MHVIIYEYACEDAEKWYPDAEKVWGNKKEDVSRQGKFL